jgi:hypothetical protein
MCFIEWNKQDGRLSLSWFWTTSSSTRTRNWASDLPEEDGHQGTFEGGRPAWSWSDRPKGLSAPLGSILLQCAHACFVASWPRASRGCTFQTFLSTPSLALLLLPLDDFTLSDLHASSPHMSPWYSYNTRPWLPPCLSFACGLIKDVGGASRDASWCMHG